MPAKIEKVAFIGLGKMGSNIARNILEAGFDLQVYNRTQTKMNPFVANRMRKNWKRHLKKKNQNPVWLSWIPPPGK